MEKCENKVNAKILTWENEGMRGLKIRKWEIKIK